MKNETFSVSGISNCGHGANFIHEGINKLVKSFLPPGMPMAETQERVCRKVINLSQMQLIHQALFRRKVTKNRKCDNDEERIEKHII